MEIVEKTYFAYEYLAKKYASKVFGYEQLGYEFDDLLQEFKIKIFTSIKSYGRRWAKYRKGEASKPVHIRYYLEAACCNKYRDFIKYISRENYKVSIDDTGFDFGTEDNCIVNPSMNKFIVNDIDLLEGLTGKERAVFSLYIRGYNTSLLRRVYFGTKSEISKKKSIVSNGDSPIDVLDIIEMQKNYLLNKYGSELLKVSKVYHSYDYDD